jgi:hypothetical protein
MKCAKEKRPACEYALISQCEQCIIQNCTAIEKREIMSKFPKICRADTTTSAECEDGVVPNTLLK